MQLMQYGGVHLLRVFIIGPFEDSIASSRSQQVIADGLAGAYPPWQGR